MKKTMTCLFVSMALCVPFAHADDGGLEDPSDTFFDDLWDALPDDTEPPIEDDLLEEDTIADDDLSLPDGMYPGCMDPTADNYDPMANYPDGSCEYSLFTAPFGCTDPSAANYDPFAIIDDGTCWYLSLD